MKRATFGLIAYTMAGDADLSDLESEFRKLDKEGSDYFCSGCLELIAKPHSLHRQWHHPQGRAGICL